jgi:predicted dehydrogenase
MTTDLAAQKDMPRREFIRQAGLAVASAAAISQTAAVFAQDSPKTMTFAMVGCAHIHAPNYAKALASRKDVKMKYAWDHDAARAASFAGTLGCQAVADPKTIWSDPDVNAVVILSETDRHKDLVLAAAGAKKHLYVEKPLGTSSDDSKAMAAAIEKAGVIFTTGYFMRTMPAHIFLKDQIAQGNFGKLTRARGSNCHAGSLGGWFDTDYRWMADLKQAGVGAFGDLGTHSLDILMWLLGDVDSVAADIKTVTGRYDDCDECGEALLKFKNGVTATLAGAWVDIDNPVTLMISGTQAHAFMLGPQLYYRNSKLDGATGRQPWTQLPPSPPEPIEQFVNAVAGQKDMPLVTPREAASRVSVMEAAYKASRTHAWAQPA